MNDLGKFMFVGVLYQTLSSLLHCRTLEGVRLSGRDVFSLKELLLDKGSQVSVYHILTDLNCSKRFV